MCENERSEDRNHCFSLSVDEKENMGEGVASEVEHMAKEEGTKGTVKNGRKSKDGMAYGS